MADSPTDARHLESAAPKATLSDFQRALAEQLLRPFCAVPAHAATMVRKGLRFESAAVILFEARPRCDSPEDWIEHPVAKFVFVKRSGEWRLLCQMRDLRWHSYAPLPEASDLARLVAEVGRDPTGMFWG